MVNVHNFPATLAVLFSKKPIVWYCNEPPELFTTWWRSPLEALNRWWVRKSDMKVVVADPFNAYRFRQTYHMEPKVLSYGVDYKFWSAPIPFEKIEDGKIRILQVGTISPYKNQRRSILLLAELLSEGFNATLTLAGGIGDGIYYWKLAKDYIPFCEKELPGITSRIHFLGQQSQEQIRRLYHQHTLLVHPVESQGGWLAPFEAMCAGLPVIVESSFPAADLIAQNHLGIVSGHPTLLALTAIKNGEYQTLNTNRIRSWVKENLTWEKFGEGMVKVFEESANKER
jgi:glycosyltransferase involved in cell wall biosynthesis